MRWLWGKIFGEQTAAEVWCAVFHGIDDLVYLPRSDNRNQPWLCIRCGERWEFK